MTLGTRIHTLRTQKGLSQGDLAERLGVSRQSVSKWETDASVPELEKLLALSDLFDLSLDELVRGDAPTPAAPDPSPVSTSAPTTATQRGGISGRMLAGTVFLCFFGLLVVLGLALNSFFSVLILSLPLLLCALVCFTVRRHTALWCTWTAAGSVLLYLYYATGISWRLPRLSLIYTPEMNYLRLAMAWAMLLGQLALMCVTVLRLSHKTLVPSRRVILRLALGWCAGIALCVIPLPIPQITERFVYVLYCFLTDALRCAALTTLLIFTFRLLRTLHAQKKRRESA